MKQTCTQCNKNFIIESDDQVFYDKLKVPAPTLCPDCRLQRRLVWRNERFLYPRTCAKTGEPIISIYAPNSPIKQVYKNSVWFSDSWDALDYGRDFDFSRPFFEQFAELMNEVPHVNLWNWNCENSEYNHCCFALKNSHMNFATDKSEDSFYGYISIDNRTVADCTAVEKTELAIECIDSDQLYNCAYCQQCRNCLDTYLSFDCRDCKFVFGSTGLRHKEYYIYNKPVTKQQWDEQIPKLLASYQALQEALTKTYHVSLSIPHSYTAIYNSQDCTGNYIWNSNNTKHSYDVRNGDHLQYIVYAPITAKDSMDCYAIGEAELLYDANFGTPAYNVQFCFWLKGITNAQYSILCVNGCDNVFGCVGLKKKSYCIFNKQYTPDEYFKLRDKIIAHMKTTGEYGQLFPEKYSPFGYNETTAAEYFPLHKDEVLARGWRWQDDTGGTFGKETITEIADGIAEVTDQICQAVLACKNCRRNYQIVKPELAIYKQMGVALPRLCPNCRHLRRIQLRNPRSLWNRQCMCTNPEHQTIHGIQSGGRCAHTFETTYSPERKEIVYCEPCYQAEIY